MQQNNENHAKCFDDETELVSNENFIMYSKRN